MGAGGTDPGPGVPDDTRPALRRAGDVPVAGRLAAGRRATARADDYGLPDRGSHGDRALRVRIDALAYRAEAGDAALARTLFTAGRCSPQELFTAGLGDP